MCEGDDPSAPSDASQALLMLDRALDYLAACDAPALGEAGQAGALVALERAEARHTAARSRILAAFDAARAYEADGQYGARPWLRAFTKVTRGAAAGAAAWARRLDGHPAVAQALAAGEVSASWAREICGWTDQLPAGARDAGDAILLSAATGGADLYDLAALGREMIERSRTGPDPDQDGGFADRALYLDVTMHGVGALRGDLTAGCAAALSAVLDALAAKAGPEDTRSFAQRRHDALEEACHRLIAARMVPGRDGQPVHLLAHIDLAELRSLPGAAELEAEWAAAQAGPGAPDVAPEGFGPGTTCSQAPAAPGLSGPSGATPGRSPDCTGAPAAPSTEAASSPPPAGPAPAGDCARADRTRILCSTSHGAGASVLSRTTANSTSGGDRAGDRRAGPAAAGGWSPARATAGDGAWYLSGAEAEALACDATIIPVVTGQLDPAALTQLAAQVLPASGSLPPPGAPGGADQAASLSPALQRRLRDSLLALGADLLSGPGGLAGYLRTRLLGRPFTGTSQPLDLGAPTAEIPPHLRRAVILRDRHCGFPGCWQPPAHCQVHHLIPRSKGGLTKLSNLKLFCRFQCAARRCHVRMEVEDHRRPAVAAVG